MRLAVAIPQLTEMLSTSAATILPVLLSTRQPMLSGSKSIPTEYVSPSGSADDGNFVERDPRRVVVRQALSFHGQSPNRIDNTTADWLVEPGVMRSAGLDGQWWHGARDAWRYRGWGGFHHCQSKPRCESGMRRVLRRPPAKNTQRRETPPTSSPWLFRPPS